MTDEFLIPNVWLDDGDFDCLRIVSGAFNTEKRQR